MPMPIKQEAVAQSCTGKWKVEMFQTPCKNPVQFLYGCLCPCCASYQQRDTLLKITGEPYVCFGGLCACGPLGEPQDKNCLILESCCCPGLAIDGNRFIVQTRFDKENTCCDDCIIWFTCLFSWAVMIAQCVGCDVPEELDLLADCLIMTVNGCMHAQQDIEIREIQKNGYNGPPQALMMALPPHQQKMIQQGKNGGAQNFGGGGPAATAFGNTPGGQPYYGNTMGAQGYSNNPSAQCQPPYQQSMPMQYQQPPNSHYSTPPVAVAVAQPVQQPIRIACGQCGNQFGSPSAGVTVQCPHCGAHNQVPANAGAMMGMPYGGGGFGGGPYNGGPYGGGGFGGGGFGGGMGGQQQNRAGTRNGMAVAGAAGAGVLGGIMLADILM